MEEATMSANIKTRFLMVSDTHGLDSLPGSVSYQYADAAIHCGDVTTNSTIDEYKASIRLLQAMNAPLKLVIAGNHDFTMYIPEFQRKVAEVQPPLDPREVEQTYGSYVETKRLLSEDTGITFLDEGTHFFTSRMVYASPYTPSLGDWGFQYRPNNAHDFSIGDVDSW
ncbi:hypothetical protein NUU61_001937 [Penicillium alfredii]|uniref:Calcineurin-like phosphoesterase domain-containing protein n=1 Tax=Penicillium alfredii TaxID=1506179 RepID=A0A9W9FQM8_9EURO|nr:uncharacterized protein NUU61_001937 [Penicillium alfredii]KAJ5104590.1 hypothetical protein NUU61_001937 [Penicillium alfredii]